MYTVVGYRDVNFTDEKSNRTISGTTIYYTCDDDNRVTGQEAGKFFMSFRVSNQSNYLPTVGDRIKVLYNRYGKIDEIVKIDSKK